MLALSLLQLKQFVVRLCSCLATPQAMLEHLQLVYNRYYSKASDLEWRNPLKVTKSVASRLSHSKHGLFRMYRLHPGCYHTPWAFQKRMSAPKRRGLNICLYSIIFLEVEGLTYLLVYHTHYSRGMVCQVIL